MQIRRKFSIILSLLVISDFIEPGNNNTIITETGEEFLEKPLEGKAKFQTLPIHVMVNEGETIKLPCFIDKIEGYVLLWKFGDGDSLLSVGSRVVSSDAKKRIKLEEKENGNYLIIDSATSEDSGNYDCHISDYEPLEIRHSVIVRTRPEVTVEERELVVEEGEDARLRCSVVAGTPRPEISWLREGRVVGLSEELVLKKVSRADSASYICRADNGYSEDHTVAVRLLVSHPPVIVNSSSGLVQAGTGPSLTLFCQVSSLPPAQLIWLRGDIELPVSFQNNSSVTDDGVQTWSLDHDMSTELDEDVDYWCVANNSLGITRRRMTVTNRPSQPILKFNVTTRIVSWSIESEANLTNTLLELSPAHGKARQISITPVMSEPGNWIGSWKVDSDGQYKVRVCGISDIFGAGHFSEWLSLERSCGSPVQLYMLCVSLCIFIMLF